MAHYANTLLVLNLGSEMIFVIAQRLKAQNIPPDKSMIVLNELISALVSSKFVADLMKVKEEILCYKSVRSIIETISQSSIMRMDESSRQKLWDLISMVFKWQINYSDDIMKLTHRHLYEIETYVTNQDTHLHLHEVQKLIEDFDKLLDSNCKRNLRKKIEDWLKPCRIKVSLLLRLGLQRPDGSFISDVRNVMAERMFQNLGENIYSIEENVLKKHEINENVYSEMNNNNLSAQLQMFVDQILNNGEETSTNTKTSLKLKINDGPGLGSGPDPDNVSFVSENGFENINVEIERNKSSDVINTDFLDNLKDTTDFRQELLKILEGNGGDDDDDEKNFV